MKTEPFTRGAKKVRREARDTSTSIRGMGGAFASIGPQMLALVAPAALATKGISEFREELERIDKIAKASKALDVSTEALAGYSHAAELSGTSLEAVQKGFQRMERSIGDALVGTGEARDEFGRLGLDLNALAELSPDAAFLELADAISKVENPFHRARIAQNIFGRGARELLPLLESGSKGILSMRQEAIDMGLTFRNDAAAGVEDLNDNMTRLGSRLDGIKTKITMNTVPALNALAGKVLEIADRIDDRLRRSPFLSGFLAAGTFGASIPGEGTARPDASGGRGAAARRAAREEAARAKSADEALKAYEKSLSVLEQIGKRGEAIRKSFLSPAEALKERIEDLRSLRETIGSSFEETFRRAAAAAVDEFMRSMRREMPDLPSGNVASPSVGRPGFTAALEESRRSARRAERWRAESLASARRREDLLRRIEDKLPLELDSTDLR